MNTFLWILIPVVAIGIVAAVKIVQSGIRIPSIGKPPSTKASSTSTQSRAKSEDNKNAWPVIKKVAKWVLILLVLFWIYGEYKDWKNRPADPDPPTSGAEPSDMKTYVVLKGDTIDVTVPHGKSLRLWYDLDEVVATTVQLGPKKVERLTLLPGITSAEVDACSYRIGTQPCIR